MIQNDTAHIVTNTQNMILSPQFIKNYIGQCKAIHFKIFLTTYKSNNDKEPEYMRELIPIRKLS